MTAPYPPAGGGELLGIEKEPTDVRICSNNIAISMHTLKYKEKKNDFQRGKFVALFLGRKC